MAAVVSLRDQQGNWDKGNNVPVSCTCFQLLKPSFDEIDPHCSLDVFPILVEEASLQVSNKCPFHGSNGEDVYSFSVLPEDGRDSLKSTQGLTFQSFLKVPLPSKKNMCLDAELDCQDCIDLQIKENDSYSPPCIMDIDLEKANSNTVEDTVGIINTEGVLAHFQKVLQRQYSLKTGEKLLQILMNHGLMLLKFTARDKSLAEKVHEVPNNRLRRCKRVTWFDSRKIVLLFSILSIMGTLVLIYLTLRVRFSQA